jgi:DNA polymerase-3 subunit epsilon
MFGIFGICRTQAALESETMVDLRAGLDEVCYVVMDTELTGLDVKKDSIISMGAVKMTGGRIHIGKTLEHMVSPETSLTRASVLVHGITPSDLENKPAIAAVLEEFRNFCEGCVVVGHFVSLDLAFLNRECRRLGLRSIDQPAIDTWRLYTWIQNQTDAAARDFRDCGGESDLFTLAKKYGIPVMKAHQALGDSFVTAQLFQRFLGILPGLGVRSVKELLRIGKP